MDEFNTLSVVYGQSSVLFITQSVPYIKGQPYIKGDEKKVHLYIHSTHWGKDERENLDSCQCPNVTTSFSFHSLLNEYSGKTIIKLLFPPFVSSTSVSLLIIILFCVLIHLFR